MKLRNTGKIYKKTFEDGNGDEFTMHYKIISVFDFRQIENKYADDKGKIKVENVPLVARDLNAEVYVGWENVNDSETGEPVKFDPNLLQYLEIELQTKLYVFYYQEVITPYIKRYQEISKNLKSTPEK